jgi:probable HAF family extracellular repeat protein
MRRAVKVLLALLAVVWLAGTGLTQETYYSVTDLGTLGGPTSLAWGINNAGQIVGSADLPADAGGNVFHHAFFYENGTMTDLGTIAPLCDSANGEAFDINEAGQVVGVTCSNGRGRAFLWDAGTMSDLGTLGGTQSSARGINNAGDVVGSAAVAGDTRAHAFLYSGGVMQDLGTLGGVWSAAHHINDTGKIVGYGEIFTGSPQRISHAFLYSGGTMTDLLPGSSVAFSYAWGINNANKVVGTTSLGNFDQGFLYNDADGSMTYLGSLANSMTVAVSINNHDQIVGYSALGIGYFHAFLYENGVMVDLNNRIPNNPGWDLNFATAINDSGKIVGAGMVGGQMHAFLLTPIEHTLTITSGPLGMPNPVASGGPVGLSVTASDSLPHGLSYAWTAVCATLGSNGSFSSATTQNPTWTAPANVTGIPQACTLQVVVDDGHGLNQTGSYTQNVESTAHTLTITSGPGGTPNPVASGAPVRLSVTALDTAQHVLSYQWVDDCPALGSGGIFSDPTAQNPTWIAPANTTRSLQICTLRVTVQDGVLSPVMASYEQIVGLRAIADFDGDGRTDLSVWRPGDGRWYARYSSSGGSSAREWGAGWKHDEPVPGDYDGDGILDFAVWRPENGGWYVLQSTTAFTHSWWMPWGHGSRNDIPVPADYDGDGRTDCAVWRPGTGEWFVTLSTGGYGTRFTIEWGAGWAGDRPVVGDYDGDGRADLAVWRPSTGTWFILRSSLNYSKAPGDPLVVQWGLGSVGDRPVIGDFDGDGTSDIAVWRGPTGQWFLRLSSGVPRTLEWGRESSGDQPAVGDYDGDGRTDIAVWRGPTGFWFIKWSTTDYADWNSVEWGSASARDMPIPR